MPNQTAKVSLSSFQQKLDAFKAKVALQQMLAQSLSAEFESLTSEFESLKRLFDASSSDFGSTLAGFGVTSINNGSTLQNIGATSSDFESTSFNSGVTPADNGSPSENIGATSCNFESSSPNIGVSSAIRDLSKLIRQRAGECLKVYYSQPNIPNRMAEIVLAFGEHKRLSVAQMRQITGASRNTLGRDINTLKRLGWLEFHGSRKNGYFTLTALFPYF
jgi:hypothetical protein